MIYNMYMIVLQAEDTLHGLLTVQRASLLYRLKRHQAVCSLRIKACFAMLAQ